MKIILKRISAVFMVAIMTVCAFPAMPAHAASISYDITYGGSSTGYTGYYVKGNVYLPVSMIGSSYCNNSGITVDSSKKRIIIDISKENIMLADDTVTSFVKSNAGTVYIPFSTVDGHFVFSLNLMEQFFKLSYRVSGNTINLAPYSATAKVATVTASTATAVPSGSSGSLDASAITLSAGERIWIEGSTSHYYTFKYNDGNLYYVLKNNIKIENIDLAKVDFYSAKKTKTLNKKGMKTSVAWQYVNDSTNITTEAPAKKSGIDVLAPTWFRLAVEGGGNIINSGDRGYTDLAHKYGYKVWATITNNMSASGSTKFTTKMFGDSSIQNRAIAQYILYSCLYDVDGINIDFEDVIDADRNGLTAFVKSMRYYTERQGLVLSVDTLIPAPWTNEYDFANLAANVDYLAVMTYDEHYSSSKTAGSIASLPWVEKAVKACLAEGVPANKLLMGVPLYTRVWVVDGSGNLVSNSTYTMNGLQNTLKSNKATTSYLETERQNYAEWSTSKGTAKVWIEDSTSITNRLKLVENYDLAGTACWQLSQGSDDIWPLFNQYLH